MFMKKIILKQLLFFMLVCSSAVPKFLISSVSRKSNIIAYSAGVGVACVLALIDRSKIKLEHLPYCFAFPVGGLAMYNYCEYFSSNIKHQCFLVVGATLLTGALLGMVNKQVKGNAKSGNEVPVGAVLGTIATVPAIAIAHFS